MSDAPASGGTRRETDQPSRRDFLAAGAVGIASVAIAGDAHATSLLSASPAAARTRLNQSVARCCY